MFRRILGFCGAGVLTLAVTTGILCGCGDEKQVQKEDASNVVSEALVEDSEIEETAESPETVTPSGEDYDDIYNYTIQDTGLNSLDTYNEKVIYEQINHNVYSIEENQNEKGYYNIQSITLWGDLTEAEIKVAVSAYKHDHPEVFWIANIYSRLYQDGNTTIQLYSYVSPEDCSKMMKKLDKAARQIMNEASQQQDEFHTELSVFKSVAEACDYDYDTADGSDKRDWKSYTAYGALVSHTAVCEGYARAMELLLNRLDIDCILVSGTFEDNGHMWNLVEVDGAWYHLDATWNDQQDRMIYDYFNLTDDQIKYDHKISPQLSSLSEEKLAKRIEADKSYNFKLYACNSDAANYYKKYAVEVEGFQPIQIKTVTDSFYNAVVNGENAVYLHISQDIDYDMATAQIFNGSNPVIASYILDANAMLDGTHQINTDTVRYTQSEAMRTVTVYISY